MPNILPETEARGRYTPSRFYYGLCNKYFTVWADYVNGPVSGIAILNQRGYR